jgi:hypothetical protein
MQDSKKGKLRHYTYGPTFFNYGMLPKTWEDPAKKGATTATSPNQTDRHSGEPPRRAPQLTCVRSVH